MFITYVDLLENHSALTAGLRRSFRLSRKDHQGSTKESRPAESAENEFLIYEEVTLYQMRPQEKPRLVVLIGKIQGMSGHSKWVFFFWPSVSHFLFFSLGSLGARINELKQKVIAENPHRYGVAVPREFTFIVGQTESVGGPGWYCTSRSWIKVEPTSALDWWPEDEASNC